MFESIQKISVRLRLDTQKYINVTVKKCSSNRHIDLTVGHETYNLKITYLPKAKKLDFYGILVYNYKSVYFMVKEE